MEPRGQLWYELERVCKDFREFSGLEPQTALDVVISVLKNMLAEREAEADQRKKQYPDLE